MSMKFVFPTLEYKEKAIDYIREFYEYNSEINGSGSLDRFLRESTYEAWLQKLIGAIDIANIPQGKVPGLTYFYVREEDGRIVGMINIRLATSDVVRTEVGHMGYSIRPTERRKHYGTQMIREALEFCKPLRLSEVVLTCDKSNLASAGVIKNCGGVLEAEFYSEMFDEVIQRYVIKNE